jgi:hypothetical protein
LEFQVILQVAVAVEIMAFGELQGQVDQAVAVLVITLVLEMEFQELSLQVQAVVAVVGMVILLEMVALAEAV